MTQTQSIQSLFPDLLELRNNDFYEIEKPILIFCITPRTGSTALCSMINKIPDLVFIDEFFNPRGPVQMYSKERDAQNFNDYLKQISDLHDNQYFGIKVSWLDFKFFAKKNIYKKFFKQCKFIYLDRFEIDNQAISLFHSIKSKKWHHHALNHDDNYEINLEDFDLNHIIRIINNIQAEKKDWHQFFYENNINYLHLHYEFYVENMNSGLEKVLNFIGINLDSEIINAITPDYIKKEKKLYTEFLNKLKFYRNGKYYLEQEI